LTRSSSGDVFASRLDCDPVDSAADFGKNCLLTLERLPRDDDAGRPMEIWTGTMTHSTASDATRWGQLAFGIICMVMIANLQYGWTLFVGPIDVKYQWGRAAIQVAFTIFVLTETWLVPIEGYLIDKFGPRIMISASGVLVAIAWVINSIADSLFLLYVGAAIGGIGAGVIYGGSVGNALKWFPDRRGLAAGLTAAGFGAGSALTVIPIANMIRSSGYESAFLWFGLGQGLVVVLVGLLLRAPAPGEVASPVSPAVQQTRRDYKPSEVLKTPVFWVMYAMFVMVGAGGLMAVAQLAPIAADFNVGTIPVSILGLTLPALEFALTIDRVLNGVCRPFFGWVSDLIGRENTMFIAFFIEGVGIYALLVFAGNPLLFVILSGLVFFAWGEIYSLFPATCTDIYGRKFATANYGMLYTAKGTAALLVPLANVLTNATGSWHAVFYVAAILNIVAAVMALAVLKPMRSRTMAYAPLPSAAIAK
jgi:MFS transporter, OFA family, oxalate/formate antiporter